MQPYRGIGHLQIAHGVQQLVATLHLVDDRGIEIIPDFWLVLGCVAVVALPAALLYWRIAQALANDDKRQLTVGRHDDSRKHLLIYLFATLLPFYRTSVADLRDLAAMVLALAFIVFLFLYLRLHYINIVLAVGGYRVFTVYAPNTQDNPYTGTGPFVLISRRHNLYEGQRLVPYRITDTVYLEPCHER